MVGFDSRKDMSQGNGRALTVATTRSEGVTLERSDTVLTIGRLKLRGKTDDLPQDWWFASTAIPLLAATIGPLANVLSIAALVSTWRVSLPNNGQLPEGADANGIGIPDPRWEVILNAISLACGFFGNFCLLLNFTRRIRYIVALPATIISWYFATGILIAIIVAMNEHVPPVRPGQTYSQGFWYAIIAAVLYLIGSMILMVNMLGYFLGHYPQHFDLDDDQRTLILQTMMFFFWLAGGAAVFSKVCLWSYADALYFCDVTVLTIGFGDYVAPNDPGRGLVFPYAVFGIIFLGLMINSIRKFAATMSSEKVIRKHQLNQRERTFGRSVTSEKELRDRLGLPARKEEKIGRRPSSARKPSDAKSSLRRSSLDQYGHFDINGRTIIFHEHKAPVQGGGRGGAGRAHRAPLSRDAKMQLRAEGKSEHAKRTRKREKLLMLKEEKDRFDAMREIQANTSRFKQYYALAWSVLAFGILWCIGALVFMFAEKRMQNLTYFEYLYFCYVSLLTIGYGDFSPKSNGGKPFFVVWSLVAIPTMTILISDMGDTIVSAINRGTFTLADWTVMPKAGLWKNFLDKNPKLRDWLERKTKEREARHRLERGFSLQDPDEETGSNNNDNEEKVPSSKGHKDKLEKLAEEPDLLSDHELARRLATAIKRTANDLRAPKRKKYSYEEWVEFTKLIRFTGNKKIAEEEEEEEGLIEWDWIGEDSPMLAEVSESEWVLERLCESLNRYTRTQAREAKKPKKHIPHKVIPSEAPYPPGSLLPTDALQRSNSTKRQSLHHDKHIDLYPAHPGPRCPNSRRSLELKHPVLSRDATGDTIIQIHHRNTPSTDSARKSESGGGSATTAISTSGSGTGSRTTAIEPRLLEYALNTDEVEHWAEKVNAHKESERAGNTLDDTIEGDGVSDVDDESSSMEHMVDNEDPTIGLAHAIDLRHVGGG